MPEGEMFQQVFIGENIQFLFQQFCPLRPNTLEIFDRVV
jgi:hypothetical protein